MSNKIMKTNAKIADFIMQDCLDEIENDEVQPVIDKLPLLVKNGMACCISGDDFLDMPTVTEYHIASKLFQKYNKDFKEYRRKLLDYEYGGAENRFAKYDERIMKLVEYSLDAGTYMVQIDDFTYGVFIVERGLEDAYEVKYSIYFVGKNWRKYKDKFFKQLDKYKGIIKSHKIERIRSIEGGGNQEVIFKPFEQVIFDRKDDLLRYIDNWLNNIPVYYKEYKMVSKLSILLHGKPGTGKSTVARAVANYLGIETVTTVTGSYFSPDGQANSASKKNRDRSQYAMNTIFTLDDIDCICKSREKDNSKENSLVLANLLAFLDNPPTFYYKAKDGIRYPVSIVIATTNYIDKLDDAVKRPGRFDLHIEMQEFGKKEAQAMCDIYHIKLEDIVKDSDKKDFVISPSYLQALCLENIDKSMKAIK